MLRLHLNKEYDSQDKLIEDLLEIVNLIKNNKLKDDFFNYEVLGLENDCVITYKLEINKESDIYENYLYKDEALNQANQFKKSGIDDFGDPIFEIYLLTFSNSDLLYKDLIFEVDL